MAIVPIPPEPQEPEGPDYTPGQDFYGAALDEEACRALRAFFELLEEWDRQESRRTNLQAEAGRVVRRH